MGNSWVSSVKDDASKTVSNAVIRSKLIDIKAQKTKRDQELAFKVATVRERIHWLAAFYVTLISFNFLRLRFFARGQMKNSSKAHHSTTTKSKISFEPLPLAWLPFIGTPFVFLYQVDFSYGTKLERLNLEAQHILKNEKHWFNEPIRLPRSFEAEYRRMMSEAKQKFPEDDKVLEDWAVFSDSITKEEIFVQTFPATRLLNFVENMVQQ